MDKGKVSLWTHKRKSLLLDIESQELMMVQVIDRKLSIRNIQLMTVQNKPKLSNENCQSSTKNMQLIIVQKI